MKSVKSGRMVVVLTVLLGMGLAAEAADATLWNWLGIPQGAQKLRDATVNRRGNRPNLERQDPLKRIADPENLESDNPAIKKAAEIKKEEDLKKQKIKAIKYLAETKCGCYGGVGDALLAALEDCTEDVRYEAAIAFCESAGDPCENCETDGCCSADAMQKLHELAYEKNEKCCYTESSEKVRAAARNALNACLRKHPPSPAPVTLPPPPDNGKGKEVPIESAPSPPGELPIETPPLETPPEGIRSPFSEEGVRGGSRRLLPPPMADNTTTIVNPIGASYLRTMPDDVIAASATSVSTPGCCDDCYGPPCDYYRGRPCERLPGAPDDGVVVPPVDSLLPEDIEDIAPDDGVSPADEFAPSQNDLAGSFGATAGSQSAAPAMIGDLFGGSRGNYGSSTLIDQLVIRTSSGQGGSFEVTAIPPAGDPLVIAHGTSPFSVDGVQFPTTATLRTTINRAAIDTLLSADPAAARIPVDEPGYINSVHQVFYHRHGSGTTAFDSTESFAHVVGGVTRPPGALEIYDQFNADWWYKYYVIDVPTPGGAVGRMKIAENTSPMPRDRLIFNYSFFDNVPLYPGGVGVNRFTPGFEKTFFDGMASFEMKMPMAVTLDSNLIQDGPTDLSHGEFGNMALTFKMLMLKRANWAYSLGLTMTVPTADDTQLISLEGTPLIQVENQSVHLEPFIGFLWTPNDRFFLQGFVQWDVDTNGNPVFVNTRENGLERVGRVNDTTFQYFDVGIGRWLYRSNSRCSRLSGIACTAELHWNRSLQTADYVTSGNFRVGNPSGVCETINATLGTHVEIWNQSLVTVGYSVPVGGGQDQMFDGELRVMFSRRFGSQDRITRTPSPTM